MPSTSPQHSHRAHDHSHHHDHHNHHDQHDHSLGEMLELDASVMREYLDAVRAWLPSAAGAAEVRRILEIGPGIGVMTEQLARLFPRAEVAAVDRNPDMIDRVRSRVDAAGVGERVHTRLGDLDTALDTGTEHTEHTDSQGFDLIWASSVLHEVADPGATLRQLGDSLSATGRLVIVEMDTPPTFLVDDSLEREIQQVQATQHGGHPLGQDWARDLEAAGLRVLDVEHFAVDEAPEDEAAARRFARLFLGRMAAAVRDELPPESAARVDVLLGEGADGLAETELRVRGRRTAWVAMRR